MLEKNHNERISSMLNIVLLIPCLNPDQRTITYVRELINFGFSHIIIVNDGSGQEYLRFFNELKQFKECTVLEHEINLGKGQAIKTGLKYYVDNFDLSKMKGIVTADSDGQHGVQDTYNVALKLIEKEDSLVLGTRNFDEESVPFKSKFGNKITTVVFQLLYGLRINDTQTGLRGIPNGFMKDAILIPGDRFEYEIAVLIKAVQKNIDITEVIIETIYYENNSGTHFNPIKDSLKIYSILFKQFFSFSFSSILSFFIDISIFTLVSKQTLTMMDSTRAIFWATLISRGISSITNYFLNSRFVFKSKAKKRVTIVKYYTLVLAQLLTSWLLVSFIFSSISFGLTLVKILVDVLLFILSYQIQNSWVFKKNK